jgi:hypothetical protein
MAEIPGNFFLVDRCDATRSTDRRSTDIYIATVHQNPDVHSTSTSDNNSYKTGLVFIFERTEKGGEYHEDNPGGCTRNR